MEVLEGVKRNRDKGQGGLRGCRREPYLHFLSTSGHFGNVAHDVFGCHSFSSSAFSTAETFKETRRK